jgi:hypothetical protein
MTQDHIVFLIVALAVGYLVRMLWLSSQNKKGCGCDAGGCSKGNLKAGSQPPQNALVQVTLNFNGSASNGAATNATGQPPVASSGTKKSTLQL